MDEAKIHGMNSLSLAYIGDAVYELYVREHLLHGDLVKVDDLHRTAVSFVKAERQSELYGEIENMLTEEEVTVFRHGRNAKSGHQPPHTSVGTYRRATGLESLIGWLYLMERHERLEEIFAVLFREA